MSTSTISDAERLGVITASATAFFFILSWILYGTMYVMGDDADDWRPMGYDAITQTCCSRRTLYESGEDAGSDSEEPSAETSEPGNEEIHPNHKID